MNKALLKKLAKKADLVNIAPDGQEYIDDIDGLEQFATLLIEQCISYVKKQKCNPGVDRKDRFFVGHDQAILDCIATIKMNTGVNE